MYQLLDDPAKNKEVDEVLQRLRAHLQRLGRYDSHAIGSALMLLLLEHQQPKGTPFDPALAHLLCGATHTYATIVCRHHMGELAYQQWEHTQQMQDAADADAAMPDGSTLH